MRLDFSNCSADKARKLLNYNTRFTVDEALKKNGKLCKKKEVPKKFEYNYELEIDNHLTPITWKEKKFNLYNK